MIVVVSDTSPIRALAYIDHLSLLPQLFDRVLVPPAVKRELARVVDPQRAVDVKSQAFLELQQPKDTVEVDRLHQQLDIGESEALVLASEVQASAVLIDERAGRAVAAQLGLPTIGTLGILVRAKRQDLIEEVTSLLDRLVDDFQFFVSGDLRREILRQVGE